MRTDLVDGGCPMKGLGILVIGRSFIRSRGISGQLSRVRLRLSRS